MTLVQFDISTTAPTAPAAQAAPRRLRAVPPGTEARGFALYVGIDEAKAAAAGTDLGALVQALKETVARFAPDAESYAAVALAPETELIGADGINEAYERVLRSDVRYRFVIDIETLTD